MWYVSLLHVLKVLHTELTWQRAVGKLSAKLLPQLGQLLTMHLLYLLEAVCLPVFLYFCLPAFLTMLNDTVCRLHWVPASAFEFVDSSHSCYVLVAHLLLFLAQLLLLPILKYYLGQSFCFISCTTRSVLT